MRSGDPAYSIRHGGKCLHLRTCAASPPPFPFLRQVLMPPRLVSNSLTHYIAKYTLELLILLSLPPEYLGLQVCVTMPYYKEYFQSITYGIYRYRTSSFAEAAVCQKL